MKAQSAAALSARPERWSPARGFMVVSTLYHLPLGIVGLLYNQTFPIGSAEAERAGSDHVFGIFETNGWHSFAALVLGAVSLYFAMRPRRARDAALAIGLLHVGIVAALIVSPPETFWLASNAADQIVHSFTAVAGIGTALLTRDTQAFPGSNLTSPPRRAPGQGSRDRGSV